MGGIVGLFDRAGDPVDERTVSRMLERISPRGRDGRDVWIGRNAGVGQQRFDTTPEAAIDDQALAGDSSKEPVLAADVRVDNRSALKETLGIAGQIGDRGLVRAAYDRWGVRAPEHLIGAFAFVVHDPRRDRLFCARDHMGIRPLYFAVSGRRFGLASEPKALHTLPWVSREPNEDRIGDFLVGAFDVGSATFYEDVSRLPPGHYAVVTPDRVDVERYWAPDPERELDLGNDEAYERRFRELFTEAVRCRLRGARPAGAFLSGGIDSSSIVTTAGSIVDEEGLEPLHTYSAVFDDVPACDEREFIRPVLETGDYRSHFVPGDQVSPLLGIDRHLRHQDGPFYPSLFMLIWRLLHEVRSEGIDVVLNGYGGDQVLCNEIRGYPGELARSLRVGSFVRTVREYTERYPNVTLRNILRNEVLVPLVPTAIRRVRHALFDDDRYLNRTPFPVDPNFASSAGLLEHLREDAVSRPPRSHAAVHRRAVTSGEPSYNLEVSDMASAAVGVEMRFPYFDKRLVEFCLALPPEQKIRDGVGRSIARRALARTLPVEIRERDSKADFGANVVHTVETYELDRIERTLFDGDLHASRYLDTARIEDAYRRMRAGEGGWTDARVLLTTTALERWLERLPRGPASETSPHG